LVLEYNTQISVLFFLLEASIDFSTLKLDYFWGSL
jgi:hypothetical protein